MSLQITSEHPVSEVPRAPGPTVHCPHSGLEEHLENRVVSMHRTSLGMMQYLRCRCGSLVIWSPDSAPKHAKVAAQWGPI